MATRDRSTNTNFDAERIIWEGSIEVVFRVKKKVWNVGALLFYWRIIDSGSSVKMTPYLSKYGNKLRHSQMKIQSCTEDILLPSEVENVYNHLKDQCFGVESSSGFKIFIASDIHQRRKICRNISFALANASRDATDEQFTEMSRRSLNFDLHQLSLSDQMGPSNSTPSSQLTWNPIIIPFHFAPDKHRSFDSLPSRFKCRQILRNSGVEISVILSKGKVNRRSLTFVMFEQDIYLAQFDESLSDRRLYVGDIVISIDGHKPSSVQEIYHMSESSDQDMVSLGLIRNRQRTRNNVHLTRKDTVELLGLEIGSSTCGIEVTRINPSGLLYRNGNPYHPKVKGAVNPMQEVNWALVQINGKAVPLNANPAVIRHRLRCAGAYLELVFLPVDLVKLFLEKLKMTYEVKMSIILPKDDVAEEILTFVEFERNIYLAQFDESLSGRRLCVGDIVVSIDGHKPSSIQDIYHLAENSDRDEVSLCMTRSRHRSRTFVHVNTMDIFESLGLEIGSSTRGIEITDIKSSGLVHEYGDPYYVKTKGVLNPGQDVNWALVQINGKPVPLDATPGKVRLRLKRAGKDLELVFLPVDLVNFFLEKI